MTEGKHLLCYELPKLFGIVPQALTWSTCTPNRRTDPAWEAVKAFRKYNNLKTKRLLESL